MKIEIEISDQSLDAFELFIRESLHFDPRFSSVREQLKTTPLPRDPESVAAIISMFIAGFSAGYFDDRYGGNRLDVLLKDIAIGPS